MDKQKLATKKHNGIIKEKQMPGRIHSNQAFVFPLR